MLESGTKQTRGKLDLVPGAGTRLLSQYPLHVADRSASIMGQGEDPRAERGWILFFIFYFLRFYLFKKEHCGGGGSQREKQTLH